jgi:uncharacterized OB-fold protein
MPQEGSLDQDKRSFSFSGRGEIFSYTVVQDPPAGFEWQAPYYLALVKLEEGPIITAQLTDFDDDPEIGESVEMVTRKLTTEGDKGMIVYGYKFRRAIQTQ